MRRNVQQTVRRITNEILGVKELGENLRVDYLNVLTAVSDPTKEIARMSGCSQMNLTATEKPNSEMTND